MKPNLFEYPLNIPKTTKTISIYQTEAPILIENDLNQTILKRLQKVASYFQMKGRPQDLGDRMAMNQKAYSLQLYKASNAFWYADLENACSEKPVESDEPIDIQTTRKTANALLEQHGLLLPQMRYTDTGKTIVSSKNALENNLESHVTETKVRYMFYIEDMPVFGAGAKVSIGFRNPNQMTQLQYFWRKTNFLKEENILSPEEALQKVTKDDRFEHLKPNFAKIRLHSIDLGYYALPPYAVQRYLHPVYAVRGTVVTDAFPRYDFTWYVDCLA